MSEDPSRGKEAKRDAAWFSARPRRVERCGRCGGCGTVEYGYALAQTDVVDGAPKGAICAIVVGSSDITTSCREAADIANESTRPVAFEFNGQVVVVRPGDDPVAIMRQWWQRQHGETPEETYARR